MVVIVPMSCRCAKNACWTNRCAAARRRASWRSSPRRSCGAAGDVRRGGGRATLHAGHAGGTGGSPRVDHPSLASPQAHRPREVAISILQLPGGGHRPAIGRAAAGRRVSDAIERKLAVLSRYVPDVERPLAKLSVIVEGQQLLLRQGEGLVEPGGQLRIDFEASRRRPSRSVPRGPSRRARRRCWKPPCGWRMRASGRGGGTVPRGAPAAGPRPEICFQLAELLYRLGDVTAARERYYMAVELDEDYVEARESRLRAGRNGAAELAVAAFRRPPLPRRLP